MKFQIVRASTFGEGNPKPIEGAYLEETIKAKFTYYTVDKEAKQAEEVRKIWTVDIKTLEDLIGIAQETCSSIVMDMEPQTTKIKTRTLSGRYDTVAESSRALPKLIVYDDYIE